MGRFVFVLSLMCAFSIQTQATEIEDFLFLDHTTIIGRALPNLKNLKWKVGDFQERQIKKGGFRGGKLVTWVDRNEGRNFWLLSELKVIFKKKKFIEMLVQRKTGKILKYIVDGEEEEPPALMSMKDCKAGEEKVEVVKVPAGQYKTLRTMVYCDEDVFAMWEAFKGVNMGGHVRQAVLNEEEELDKPRYLIELVKFGRK